MDDRGRCLDCAALVVDVSGSMTNEGGVRCPEGSRLRTLDIVDGYYRFEPSSQTVYECAYPENCVGGNGTGSKLCKEGAGGPLCSLCDVGYYLEDTTKQCEACEVVGDTWFLGPLLAVIFVLILAVVAFCVRDRVLIFFSKSKVSGPNKERCPSPSITTIRPPALSYSLPLRPPPHSTPRTRNSSRTSPRRPR